MGGFDRDHFEIFIFHLGHIGFIRAGIELGLFFAQCFKTFTAATSCL
jgi:hypothetical protein